MTKPYHLTQEQALEIAMHISANLVIRNYQEDLQEFANAVLDEVLGEPLGEVTHVPGGAGILFPNASRLEVLADGTKLYAPRSE